MTIKVMIVDDSAVMREVMQQLLAPHKDIEVIGAAMDPLLAMQKMQSVWPDVILLDINLPLKNGHEVLLEIKGNEKTRRIPVMMLTTSSAPEDINGCYDKHANLYMTKPSDMNSFEDALNAVESFWNDLVHLPRQ